MQYQRDIKRAVPGNIIMSQTSKIDVSVIIPTYHRENLVIEAIKSVLAQAEVTVEIIVVDD